MRSLEFLQVTTEALKEFLQDEVSRIISEPQFEVSTTLPALDRPRSAGRSGLLGQFFGNDSYKIYLLPYLVQRAQLNRNSQRIPSSIVENGLRIAVSKKAPESYRIRYVVTGLPMSTSMGQTLLSALISIFFDHTQIQFDTSTGPESVRISELANQDDALAVRLLSNSLSGAESSPLYLFEVEVDIQTDTIVEKTKFVQSRQIQFSKSLTANNKMEKL